VLPDLFLDPAGFAIERLDLGLDLGMRTI
jgi:hypothetical protein